MARKEKMSFLNTNKPAIVADKFCQKVRFQPFCLEKTNGIGFVQCVPNKFCKTLNKQ
jgi:hypothetical protein